MDHPQFEIVTTTAGVLSIKNKQMNEIMHNPVGPWEEANRLYIKQSNLSALLKKDVDQELVIFDVGLGAAANALAALHCLKGCQRPIRILSFEIDLELLKFALNHAHLFDFFKGFENAIETLLSDHIWKSDNIIWELHHGDFLQKIKTIEHKCHLIFYDPYSPKVNTEMWTTPCFKQLRQKCQPNAKFFNYSQATPIRAALLEAGFYVGYGIATGLKERTTEAACQLTDLEEPLDERWLQRWKRSHTPLPIDCKDPGKLKEFILNHEQFKGI